MTRRAGSITSASSTSTAVDPEMSLSEDGLSTTAQSSPVSPVKPFTKRRQRSKYWTKRHGKLGHERLPNNQLWPFLGPHSASAVTAQRFMDCLHERELTASEMQDGLQTLHAYLFLALRAASNRFALVDLRRLALWLGARDAAAESENNEALVMVEAAFPTTLVGLPQLPLPTRLQVDRLVSVFTYHDGFVAAFVDLQERRVVLLDPIGRVPSETAGSVATLLQALLPLGSQEPEIFRMSERPTPCLAMLRICLAIRMFTSAGLGQVLAACPLVERVPPLVSTSGERDVPMWTDHDSQLLMIRHVLNAIERQVL